MARELGLNVTLIEGDISTDGIPKLSIWMDKTSPVAEVLKRTLEVRTSTCLLSGKNKEAECLFEIIKGLEKLIDSPIVEKEKKDAECSGEVSQ